MKVRTEATKETSAPLARNMLKDNYSNEWWVILQMSHSGALYVLFCFTSIDASPEPTSKNIVPRLIAARTNIARRNQ